MEDVIFAGTAGRPPLGRAEVTLTIDNTDGALPIEYTEVSITRRMFRSGESEYEINGDRCRLLDIQELLSDSGIGREMHVIVGQGQLDAVLSAARRTAAPSSRRPPASSSTASARRRRSASSTAMQANLNRLTDLTAELRRQLKPLGRQAEVARRAAGIQADLRDARLRLLADDLVTAARRARPGGRRRDRARERRAAGRGAPCRSRRGGRPSSRRAGRRARRCSQPRTDTWYRLSALQERFRGVAAARRRAAPAPLRRRADERPRAAIPTSSTPRPSGSPPARRSCRRARGRARTAGRRGGRARRRWRPRSPRRSGRWSPRPAPSPTGARAWPG